MRSLVLLKNDHFIGQYAVNMLGTPRYEKEEEGMLHIQRFGLEIPLTTTQEYSMKGFEDENMPKITVTSIATPSLLKPDGTSAELKNLATRKLETVHTVRTDDVTGQKYLEITCRFIVTASFTLRNFVSLYNCTLTPADEDSQIVVEQSNQSFGTKYVGAEYPVDNVENNEEIEKNTQELDEILVENPKSHASDIESMISEGYDSDGTITSNFDEDEVIGISQRFQDGMRIQNPKNMADFSDDESAYESCSAME